MSDWLMQGVAAARADEKEMARFYLERALIEFELGGSPRSADELNERLDAYYWLSHVTDEPAQKRDYLEHALAINPAHPEARRDLAILEGRLKPAEVVDPNRLQGALAPDTTPPPDTVLRLACPQCGGKQVYDVRAGSVACTYCGHRLSAEEAQRAAVAAQDFTATLYTARAHRWSVPAQRALHCEACGARFVLPPAQVAGSCPFCGSAHAVESAAADLIEPQAIAPFRVNAEACVERIRAWLASREFAPRDLGRRAALARPRAVYLPFWVFDAGGVVGWRGMLREVDSTRRQFVWASRSGQESAMQSNLLVPASRGLDAQLLRALSEPAQAGAFDLSQLVPYDDRYLADWPAEIYQIALADASLQARQAVVEAARRRIAATMPGEVRDLTYSSAGVVVNTYQLILLPVWVAGYTYKRQTYLLAVNGQSGAVQGAVPRSGLQRLAAGLMGDGAA